jgi:hypothetical protein
MLMATSQNHAASVNESVTGKGRGIYLMVEILSRISYKQ